jgi:hypothetical protein
MPRVGLEPTFPAFERAKTVHVLDRAANVIGSLMTCCMELIMEIVMSSTLESCLPHIFCLFCAGTSHLYIDIWDISDSRNVLITKRTRSDGDVCRIK